ncbi:MAG TPA: tyrosine-type recombinase/integrase [Armatimonadota bacterium]|nr:tyrosine-type recombinase/integrase [Armatimonadota bacterium]
MESDSKSLMALRGRLAETDTLPSSQERVILDCRQLEEWFVGTYGTGIDPDDVAMTSADLADFRNWVLRRVQASTCSRKLASIRSMLKLLAPQVLTTIRMPKLPACPKPAPSGFTRRERLAIARGISRLNVRDRAICTVALWTGARASSIAELKLSNVDLRPRSGSVTFDVLKGSRGGRTVTVPANVELRDALAAWVAIRPPVEHDHLFCSERYPFEGITRWTVHDICHRRLARELPRELADKLKGTHQARHSLARLLIQQGVPLPDVAAILGHSSVATTANIYMRPSESDLRNHLERAVGEKPQE